MKDLRNLLLDCRAALRRADPQFENSPLRARMDETIIGMSKAEDTPREVAAAPQTFSAQQVAYAWQQVARELHFTHPELYAELGREVRERLQVDTFVDPNAELVRLQVQLKQVQAERDSAREAVAVELAAAHGDLQANHAVLQDELAGLCHALSAAVALDGSHDAGDAALAQQRIRVLVEAAQHGGGLPKARAAASGDAAPTVLELQQVSRGVRPLSDAQREWCVGEAVVRSHFALSPTQLLADGDPALATLLLQATHAGA